MNFSASIRFGSEILSNIEEQTAECSSFKQTKILLTIVRLKGYFFKDVSIRLGDLEGVIFISINISHFHYVLDMLLDETDDRASIHTQMPDFADSVSREVEFYFKGSDGRCMTEGNRLKYETG